MTEYVKDTMGRTVEVVETHGDGTKVGYVHGGVEEGAKTGVPAWAVTASWTVSDD